MKTVKQHAIHTISYFFKKMISFGFAQWFDSIENLLQKRGKLLWAIMSKKNFINLHPAAFVTVFTRNLPMPTNFAFFKKPLDNFFYKFENPEINQH